MVPVLLDGVVNGVQMGLLAAGLTLVYGLGGVLNLAHGALAVAAGLVTALTMEAGIPAVPAALLGIAVAALVALLLDRTVMRPVYTMEHEGRVLLSLLLSLGVAFVIDGVLGWRYPNESLTLRIGGGPVELFGITMRRGGLVGLAIALAVISGLIGFLRATTLGRAVRSVIQDETGARLIGIDPARARTLIFVLSGAFAGVFAITSAMSTPVTVTAGFGFTTLALIVTVVGGLGSATGALQAGVLLGIINALSSFYIGSYITTIVLLLAAALTILVRPSGLAGRST